MDMTEQQSRSPQPTTDGKPPMRGVARGSVANLVGAAVMAGSNLGLTILITHGVPSATAGLIFSATSLFILATTLGMLGTNTGLVYFIARSRALDRIGHVSRYFRTGAVPVVAVGTLMGAALFVLAPQVADLLNADNAGEATTYLRVLAVFVPFAGIENVTLAAIRGLGSMRANVVVEQLGRSVVQVALVALALLTPTAWTLGLGWALPYAPAALAAYVWWRRDCVRILGPGFADAPVAQVAMGKDGRPHRVGREFWGFTTPRAVASVGQMAIQRLDIVLVAALAGSVEAAIYTAATRFLVVGQMVNRAISSAVQPRLAEALAHDDRKTTNHLYQTSTAWLMIFTWPLFLFFICFGPTVMKVFGSGYQAGSTVIVILAISMLIATGCGMVDMVLTMAGRTSWNLANVLAGLGVNVGLDLWLIPSHGMVGAAIGWAAAIVAQNALALSQTGLTMGLHPFGWSGLLVAGLASACFGLVGAGFRLLWGANLSSLLVALVVGGALYLVGLYLARGPLQLSALRRRSRTRPAPAEIG